MINLLKSIKKELARVASGCETASQLCVEKAWGKAEEGFMIFPCCAVPLRQRECTADTSLELQNQYEEVLKPFNMHGL